MWLNKRAQTTLEYALLITVVIAALIGMNVYMQKGIQGKLKQSASDIARPYDPTKYSEGWGNSSTGNTITKEQRNIGTSDGFTTTTVAGETVTSEEHDNFGTTPPAQHVYKP